MSNYPLDTIRHSAAHVMAAAVQKLYPDAKFDIGPATETASTTTSTWSIAWSMRT